VIPDLVRDPERGQILLGTLEALAIEDEREVLVRIGRRSRPRGDTVTSGEQRDARGSRTQDERMAARDIRPGVGVDAPHAEHGLVPAREALNVDGREPDVI
jgi:hypothetical protein